MTCFAAAPDGLGASGDFFEVDLWCRPGSGGEPGQRPEAVEDGQVDDVTDDLEHAVGTLLFSLSQRQHPHPMEPKSNIQSR